MGTGLKSSDGRCLELSLKEIAIKLTLHFDPIIRCTAVLSAPDLKVFDSVATSVRLTPSLLAYIPRG